MEQLFRWSKSNMTKKAFLFLLVSSINSFSYEVLKECEGEACDCFQGYRDSKDAGKPIKTIRPFTLYKKMDKNSKKLGQFKPGVKAIMIGPRALILHKGSYLVKSVNKKILALKPGDLVNTFFYLGEGHKKIRKSKKWIHYEGDEIKLEEKLPTNLQHWIEVKKDNLSGYTLDKPFEHCFE